MAKSQNASDRKPLRHPQKFYKAVMIEDESTILDGCTHPMTCKNLMENHTHFHVLGHGKDYKIVRDYEREQLESQKSV